MRLWINDYEFNNPAERVYLDDPIEGLDIPPIRSSTGSNTGQPGGYMGAQKPGARPVSIPGHIFSDNVTEALSKRREMQSIFKLHPEINAVRILDDAGQYYAFDAYLIDFKMPIDRSFLRSNFKIELEAPDPVIYDDAAGAALSATINQVIPGGVQFLDNEAPQFDSFYFSAGQATSTVDNTSETESYPIIVIQGDTTDPTFTNRTTGESFRLASYAVGSDQVTQIDMRRRTVRLGLVSELNAEGQLPDGVGGSVFNYVPLDASWWALMPGENEIEFTSGDGGDVTTATIYWRPGYMGI